MDITSIRYFKTIVALVLCVTRKRFSSGKLLNLNVSGMEMRAFQSR